MSHGCVRVEKPLDFAIFLLKDKDEETIEKIKYSMNADTLSNRKLVIGSLKVEPQIPLSLHTTPSIQWREEGWNATTTCMDMMRLYSIV